MDKLVFLNGTSVNSVIEASDSVPYVVQTDSSGGFGFVGCVLIVMMIVLILLVIILISMELRQNNLRDMVFDVMESMKALEKKIKKPTDEGTHSAWEESKKSDFIHTTPKDNEILSFTSTPNANNSLDIRNTLENGPEEVVVSECGKDAYNTNDSALTGAIAYTYNAAGNPGKPDFVAGLKVNNASYYTQSRRVRLDDISMENAFFILYTDMTVRPNEQQFNVYNNAAYYTRYGFTKIFSFQDKEGYRLDMRGSIKCLRVDSPAKVTKSKNGYILEEKGILIAEER